MEPTLLIGDRILVPGGESLGELRRGDLIAFHFPRDRTVVFIKRLIGMPQDHLRIKNGKLILNSQSVNEVYVRLSNVQGVPRDFPLKTGTPNGELIVPANAVFVLGDNRDYSYDSRSWGFVALPQIIGVAREIVSSEDPATKKPRANRSMIPIPRGDLK
jgi:signal peptidase I